MPIYCKKYINTLFAKYLASLKNQLDMLIKGLVTLSLTLSVWVMCLDLSHSQSDLSPDFTLNPITTVTEKSFSSFKLQEISIHDNSTLLVLNSDNVVVNRIGSYQYGAMKVCYYVAFVMAIYMVFISSVMLVQKKNRKLIAFALLTVTLLFLTGALTNLVFSAKVVLSPQLQLVIILFIFSLYLTFYSVFHRSTQSNTALLAFASQSGSAFSIAKRIHALVPDTFDLRCLSTLSPNCLNQYQKVFLIASTYGQGQPPEKALSFVNQMKKSESFNSSFEFSILALGDRTYQHFCAFGHQVAQLFKDKGARPINDVVEVDKMDKDAIAKWWHVVSRAIGVTTNKASITTNGMIETYVLSNTQANPNNQKRAAHYLSLSRGNLNYQAGDLLEVIPKLSKEKCLKMIHHHGLNADDTVMYQGQQTTFIEAIRQSDWLGETADTPQQLINQLKPLPARVYSIASSPFNKTKIDIFVRRLIKNDGSVGIASDYLCNLSADDELTVSIRSHPNFSPPLIKRSYYYDWRRNRYCTANCFIKDT